MGRPTHELLVERGIVSPEAVVKAEARAAASGTRLCSELLAAGEASEGALVAILSERHGWPGIDLSRSEIAADALRVVPEAVALADGILPLSTDGGRIHLALADPDAADRVLAEVRFVTGMEVSPYVAVAGALRHATTGAYGALERGEATWRGAGAAPGCGLAVVHPPGIELPDGDEVVVEVEEGAAEEGAAPGAADEPMEPADLAGGTRRILVVDDEPEIRTLLERSLAASGYEVESAPDGEEALARIAARPPALVLLDAMLPRIHGFEVARRLRADPRTREVPVVMMTAVYRGWRFAQDAREAYGAEDYVEKPFRIPDLLARIEAVLEATAAREKPRPSGGDLMLRRGKELLLAGRLEAAVAALEEAIAADPFSAEAHHQLAKALRAQGEHFRAMTSFERAVELRPDFFPALRSLAALYAEKGFRRKAVEALERAMAAAPDTVARDAVRADLLELLEA
ncbi:MAG TPA: response regulator [Anaeromyxobacteraceae bacterium]|nr:response regulator [Anaeromyxobacteraceae bacterium]